MKKGLAIIIALVLVFSLAACGTTGTTSSSGVSAATSPSATAASASPAAASAVAASATLETLKIGVLANLTGWFATIDTNNVNVIKTYADMINAEGGVKAGNKSYMIELDIQDGQSDVTGVRNAAQILANDGVKYVIETDGFWVEGAVDIFNDAGIMNIQAMNNLDFKALNADLPHTYSFCNGCGSQYSSAIQALVKNYPNVKTVVYAQSDDGTNSTGIALVKDLCAQYGLTYIDKPVIFDPNATDYAPIALQITNTGADAYIGDFTPPIAGGLLKEIRHSGSQMVAACVMGPISAYVVMAVAGPDVMTNVFTLGFDLTSEQNNTEIFWKVFSKFQEIYGQDAANNFNSNFANSLYVLTNLMTGAKSIEVKDVQAYWNSQQTLDTFSGSAKIGGAKTYGINNVLSLPDPVSIAKDGQVSFGGWYNTDLP